MASPDHTPAHVIQIFNEMAKTYGAVNLLSSFGFSHFWRKSAVDSLAVSADHLCADLMCGMGEASELMIRAGGKNVRIRAIDFCPEMTKRCEQTIRRREAVLTTVRTCDVFEMAESLAFDRICCSFGLKTLDADHLNRFAGHVASMLKQGGKAAFVEIHVPNSRVLRWPYLVYVRHVIPLIGWLCLGNPDCYRNLAYYTEDFASRDFFAAHLRQAGLKTTTKSLFLGCAKLYLAEKRRS